MQELKEAVMQMLP